MSADVRGSTMPALVFEFDLTKLAKSKLRGMLSPGGYWKPGGAVGLKQVPRPTLPADDWVIVKTVYGGICGSDMMELTLAGAADNPLRSFLTFPQVMGHEIAGVVESAGPKVTRVKPGDRVALSPWLSCGPRGISPECPRCAAGDYAHCRNFRRGLLPPGMHFGVTDGFGGFAPLVAAHESQCFKMAEGVSFEAAVLADPFAVAFHSCLSLQPDAGDLVLVHGLGVIGLATVMCLKNLFNVKRVVAVGRYGFQKELAERLGAERVFTGRGPALVEEVAGFTGAELYTPYQGSKWSMDGVDGIIDTIGSAASLEAGMRFLRTQGRLVFTGVSAPARCENTPHYFKELTIMGSNSFAVEYFEGRREHAFEFYLDFLQAGRLDAGFLVTHKFRLEQYEKAFNTLADKKGSGAVKAVFDFT
jgi:threonine dehydrogenase-like Zn-dependent dehydrogenase